MGSSVTTGLLIGAEEEAMELTREQMRVTKVQKVLRELQLNLLNVAMYEKSFAS